MQKVRARLVMVVMLAACTATEPSGPQSPLLGTWRLEARLKLNGEGATCFWAGDLEVRIASDTAWLGNLGRHATCSNSSDFMDGTGTHDASGTLAGQDLTFTTTGPFPYVCAFRGTVAGKPPSRAQGTVACQDVLSVFLFLFPSRYEGEWSATR